MEYNDLNTNIDRILLDAFYEQWQHDLNMDWDKYINCKNLGVRCTVIHETGGWKFIYKVTNQHQWMFSRIRYGI